MNKLVRAAFRCGAFCANKAWKQKFPDAIGTAPCKCIRRWDDKEIEKELRLYGVLLEKTTMRKTT